MKESRKVMVLMYDWNVSAVAENFVLEIDVKIRAEIDFTPPES